MTRLFGLDRNATAAAIADALAGFDPAAQRFISLPLHSAAVGNNVFAYGNRLQFAMSSPGDVVLTFTLPTRRSCSSCSTRAT